MSLIITDKKPERQQVVLLRRQAVFMFIVTHLDDDGCFSGSDQYIANTVAGSNRKSISRARQSLQETGDVMVVESGRHDAKGNQLPNKVCPVPTRTFWVREWVRGGSQTTLEPESRVHGENATSCPRSSTLKPEDLTSQTDALVSTVKTRGHDHKHNITALNTPHLLSVEQKSVESRACSRVHGLTFTKYIDPPVARALEHLRGELEKVRGYLAKYDSAINREDVRRVEQQIAELEGRL